jgi:hypothetical protein
MNRLKLAEQIWKVTDRVSPVEANIETKKSEDAIPDDFFQKKMKN